jgi:hypothetical protein
MRDFSDYVARQPVYCWYAFVVVVSLGVGLATGHSIEATLDNTGFVVIFVGIGDTIRSVSKRRRTRS